jgi:DNA-binding response OmpR family regulator
MSTNTGPGGNMSGLTKGPNGPGQRAPRVLFADDSEDVLDPLVYFAEKRGWIADKATSVEQIMAHIERRCKDEGPHCYDAFIFDITFKGEPGRGPSGSTGPSGVQAVRAIRRKLPNVPVIFITGWTSRLVTGEAERVGQEVITKPFDPNYVLDRTEVWMAWAGQMMPRHDGPERRERSINRSGHYRRASDIPITINERVAAAVSGVEAPRIEAPK